MSKYQRFILDKEKISFIISENKDIWIKRVFTEKGILFECNYKNTLSTFDNTWEVNEWYNQLEI
jgi:hypothetical protein